MEGHGAKQFNNFERCLERDRIIRRECLYMLISSQPWWEANKVGVLGSIELIHGTTKAKGPNRDSEL